MNRRFNAILWSRVWNIPRLRQSLTLAPMAFWSIATIASVWILLVTLSSGRSDGHDTADTLQPAIDTRTVVPYTPQNIFMSSAKSAPQPKKKPKRTINPLGLQLTGILKGLTPQRSYAIIQGKKYPSQSYQVGDRIPGNLRIAAIYHDYIKLEGSDGHSETLHIPVSLLVANKDIEQLREMQKQNRASPAPNSSSNPRLLEIAADADRSIRRYQKQIAENPLALLNAFSVKMDLTTSNELRGLVVSPGRDKNIFNTLGFEKGDLVTHVNGEKITRNTNGKKMIEQIVHDETVTVRVLRNRNPMDLRIRLR